MKKSTLNLLASLIFLIVLVFGLYWIWSNSAKSSTATPESYTPLDISGVKEQAVSLVEGRENNSIMPIPTPTAKMGRTNPFSNPE